MKKTFSIFTLSLLLSPAFAFAAGEITVDPATVSTGQDTHITTSQVGGDAVILYNSAGCSNPPSCDDRNYLGGNSGDRDGNFSDLFGVGVPSAFNGGDGTVYLVYVPVYDGTSAVACTTLDGCITGGYETNIVTITVGAPSPTGLQSYIDNANVGFNSMLGANPSSVTSWMGSNLLLPWAGYGFALLYLLRHWILALITLGVIVFFAFRAYQYFRVA